MNDKPKRKSIVANDERMLKVLEENLKKSYREEVKVVYKNCGGWLCFCQRSCCAFSFKANSSRKNIRLLWRRFLQVWCLQVRCLALIISLITKMTKNFPTVCKRRFAAINAGWK